MSDPIVIVGVANDRSLATAAARALVAAGHPVLLTWQSERHEPRVRKIAAELGATVLGQLDVTDAASIAACVQALAGQQLGGLVHAIAFGRLADADGSVLPVHQVDAERWAEALEISARSLPALVQAFQPYFAADAGVVTLTYHGGRRVSPGYNLMGVAKAALEAAMRYCAAELGPQGVRINAVSAGPVRTAAASGVPDFAQRLEAAAHASPLRRTVRADEVGAAVAWLIGASGITGAIVPVDAGLHIM